MQPSEEAKTPGGVSEFSNLDSSASPKRQATPANQPSWHRLPIILACSHILALLIGISVAYFFLTPPRQPAIEKAEKTAPNWEYQVEDSFSPDWTTVAGVDPQILAGNRPSRENLNRRYNFLAAQGWEFVGPHGDNKWGFLVFKRPKR